MYSKKEFITLLVVGSWLLVVGCWLLVVGCWLLVVGKITKFKAQKNSHQFKLIRVLFFKVIVSDFHQN
ncbi:hypothetical protein [Polaribacter sp.]|uniref:hypothetical protein n=1 Tax=Polaribacter sp. TaxID=1920175 RepID=UPI003F6BF40C